MHQWSVDRGHLFNTIMGIPEYYKQFGYEFALDAWGGSTTSPELLDEAFGKDDVVSPFTVRDAEKSDAEFIADTYANIRDRSFVSMNRNADIVERELFSIHRNSAMYWQVRILENEGRPVGYYMFGIGKDNKGIRVDALEIIGAANWLDATKSMMIDLREM